ncbi:hypothetical protein HPT25_24270 [Bacillus sp. BRMEA1]|uniref:hypothetical protein n=1 Tax=Neobacillus endophyticus TaxID=2738405 RepID=UPI0015651A6C|nr:hypothetical protein [Neobacillus endophyticus]NRD80442.1 hypothetical protein [Neobacillus endophyticus]
MKKKVVFLLVIIHFLLIGQVQAEESFSYKIDMPNWKEVDRILPRYSKFTVLDVESGKKFKVQRRAGSNHADVQPLTAKDTRIMKQIYGGKWSWKRRAIIVIHKEHWIAASMHGMPHGAGALKNNFPGHFCIHFYGSTTHRTNNMDLSHMLMILKAAGKLDHYLGEANPYEVINAYITGFKQQDSRIASQASLQAIRWKPILKRVENIRISRMELLPPEDLTDAISVDVPIEIDLIIKKRGGVKYRGVMHLVRFSPADAWKVDSLHFLKDNDLL